MQGRRETATRYSAIRSDGAGGYAVRWLAHEPGGEGAEMPAEALMALAALAGNTVVAAASTDAWKAGQEGVCAAAGAR
jgi:hypothetical protein